MKHPLSPLFLSPTDSDWSSCGRCTTMRQSSPPRPQTTTLKTWLVETHSMTASLGSGLLEGGFLEASWNREDKGVGVDEKLKKLGTFKLGNLMVMHEQRQGLKLKKYWWKKRTEWKSYRGKVEADGWGNRSRRVYKQSGKVCNRGGKTKKILLYITLSSYATPYEK